MDKSAYYRVILQLRWGDMDAVNHLNNAVFFRFFEEARTRWVTELGIWFDGMNIGNN